MYETNVILAVLYRDYWATEKQREKIKLKEKYDLQQLENEKIQKSEKGIEKATQYY